MIMMLMFLHVFTALCTMRKLGPYFMANESHEMDFLWSDQTRCSLSYMCNLFTTTMVHMLWRKTLAYFMAIIHMKWDLGWCDCQVIHEYTKLDVWFVSYHHGTHAIEENLGVFFMVIIHMKWDFWWCDRTRCSWVQ
jgi:hypothetical protein